MNFAGRYSIQSLSRIPLSLSFLFFTIYIKYELRFSFLTFFSVLTKVMNNNKEGEADNCSICLDELTAHTIDILPLCQHKFHTRCIHTWALNNNQCPNCRSNISLQSNNNSNRTSIVTPPPDVVQQPRSNRKSFSFFWFCCFGVLFGLMTMCCVLIGVLIISPEINYKSPDILTKCLILNQESVYTNYCLPRVCS
jgi:hypothetical protein